MHRISEFLAYTEFPKFSQLSQLSSITALSTFSVANMFRSRARVVARELHKA